MKSATLSSFWAAYESLNEDIKRSNRKAYRLWAQNPFILLCISSASIMKRMSGL